MVSFKRDSLGGRKVFPACYFLLIAKSGACYQARVALLPGIEY